MMKLEVYFHTLKYLKLSQIYYRIIRYISYPKLHNITSNVAERLGNWLDFHLYEQKLLDDGSAKFLNKYGVISSSDLWNMEGYEKLWLYNLHYFDDLNAFDADKRTAWQVDLITRWIHENPIPKGKNAWEPYPTSLRIVNWIKSFLSHIEPSQEILDSLAKQVDFLSQNLERHLLGNHLFVNAKALIFAGLYFDDKYAQNWLSMGLEVYKKELNEQVLSDGGNFELAPMYHVIMLVDLLDLLNLFKAFPERVDRHIVTKTHRVAMSMCKWLNAMSHSDGKISFFNDSAFGVAPENSVVFDYARGLGLDVAKESVHYGNLIVHDLVDTGFVAVKSEYFTLIADIGEVGPSYQPGHAHADTLSFELTFLSKRIFVNSGISEYGVGKERLRQRKTAAHNTVVVNRLDSSQVWSGFRVAKRAKIIERALFQQGDDVVSFSGAHNGFEQQGVKCIHKRMWTVEPQKILISDMLLGDYDEGVGYLHLHPDVVISEFSNTQVKLLSGEHYIILNITGAEVKIEETTWHPEFGMTIKTKKISLTFIENKMSVEIYWQRDN
jgi:uncharacterized heparinase superfamily protein